MEQTLVKQGSEEWKALRRYRFTSSMIFKLLTEAKDKEAKSNGELGKTAKTYVIEKVTLELGGYVPEFENDAMEWGTEQEPKARTWYQQLTGFEVQPVGFIIRDNFYGGSPDNKVVDNTLTVNKNGALEIKNPSNSVNHIKHCLIDSAEYFKKEHPNYYWQCVSHMLTLGVPWCDFVSFDERIDYDCGFFRFRLYRDEADVNLLTSKIKKAAEYKVLLLDKLKSMRTPSIAIAHYDTELQTTLIGRG
jgi:hypothetical protein